MNTVLLTDDQFRLLQAILLNVYDTRSCLPVAEQLGAAFDENGDWNDELVEHTEATFNSILPLFRI